MTTGGNGGITLTPTLDQAGRWSVAALPGGGLGERVGIDGVLTGLSRRGRRHRVHGGDDLRGFGWDRRDGRTREWWPQGITTTSDSGRPPVAGQTRVLLAAWYRKDRRASDTAARLSVVDLGSATELPERPGYDHVLLVEADQDPVSRAARHAQVRVHAGGLVWWGDVLLVADTRHGLRAFDLRDVVRVDPRAPGAYGCRYLLAQCGRWTASADDGVRPLRWSFVSVDRTAPESQLVAGEYSRGDGARLARFPLPDSPDETLTPTRAADVVTTGIASMQGACRVRGRFVISASRGRHRRGHLWTGTARDGFRQHVGALPVGPEDLSYDRHTGRLWTQTEYPGSRGVWSVPLPP